MIIELTLFNINLLNFGDFKSMQHFKKILQEQSQLHPSILPQDIAKLCYQATFGAEHLLLHRNKAFDYFMQEYDNTPANSMPIFEVLCNSYARCNLGAWKQLHLPAEWLFEIFYHTASEKSLGKKELFWNYMNIAETLVMENQFSFSKEEWDNYVSDYKMHDVTAVHHSEQYRKNEQPAYRLIHTKYIKLLPILEKLVSLSNNHVSVTDNVHIITIDGRAGAGKSTVAQLLSHILHAPTIEMDDFFLPPDLRTNSRLKECAGNVHYERFCEEVLPCLKETLPFSYRRFDCQRMDYHGKKEISSSKWRIVEGSYCMHPNFGNYMDFAIFCDISSEEQLSRIRLRNGEAMLKRFVDVWIPMEEQYFETENIRKRCDIVLI